MKIADAIKKNIDLTPYTTFHINGTAEFFVAVKNERELIEAAVWAEAKKLPLNILAGGSNILIVDKKIRGLVIKISGEQFSLKNNKISSWAGTGLTKLSLEAERAGFSGLEWAYGIPGTVGGAARGNAGAFGRDISGNLAGVEAYDLSLRKKIRLSKKACAFSYRGSIFKKNKNLLITRVKLKIIPGRRDEIKKIMSENLKHRHKIQPRGFSAGSVIKNLLFEDVARQNKMLADELTVNGRVRGGKIAAGYLIDQLGLKGAVKGGAKISDLHANFIMNTGNAGAKDVIYLINLIKKKIKAKYGIITEEEVHLLKN